MTAETGQVLEKRLSRALVSQLHPGALKALPVKPREGDPSTYLEAERAWSSRLFNLSTGCPHA